MPPTYGFPPEAFDPSRLPGMETEFLPEEHLKAFAAALAAPEPTHGHDELSTPLRSPLPEAQNGNPTPPNVTRAATASLSSSGENTPHTSSQRDLFITAQNDWAPIPAQTVRDSGGSRGRLRRRTGRSKDETREGYFYALLKWPFLLTVGGWILSLGIGYLATRFYIFMYEYFIAWRGRREKLRRAMRATSRYEDWVPAAKELDRFLGNDQWRVVDDYAYYDSRTVKHALHKMRKNRIRAEAAENNLDGPEMVAEGKRAVEELESLVEICIKNNWAGIENPRLYSQSYYGTKHLVQNFVDEAEKSLRFLLDTKQLDMDEKRILFKRLNANYGRTALCLSGGAGFAYYHFGVVKALLEADLLPDVITGTSGGALVAALVATRTNDELKQLLVPALAKRITACHDSWNVWMWRWYKTGARFDSVDWAMRASWWARGSMTFKEAFERTGRILNVSCVPADPHSPTILCNYLTSPDCVIWSAVLASAAVPGILNPVVLMMKTRSGELVPYSFGHKWKDGSLRTDIPIKALNLHFNVNFTIVSQVNPHINLFFFSSRGAVGQPVTHRKGRGWRGGFLGSATEQYIKLDLNKWLKVLRHLELLPRPLGQDWSQLWLQQFSGTITIWPQSVPSDFWYILSDPNMHRLARMIHEGQQSCFPKLSFVRNRLRIERLVEQGRRITRTGIRRGSIHSIISEDDLHSLMRNPLGDESSDSETTAGEGLLGDIKDDSEAGGEKDEPFITDTSAGTPGEVEGAMGADEYQDQEKLLATSE